MINERRKELGDEIRALDPAARARHDAEWQACAEITGYEPDPINPPIVSPETHKRIMARADEIDRKP